MDDVFYNAFNHGCYIASLSSFYRVARAHNRLLKQRRRTPGRKKTTRAKNHPPHVVATAPGQVLCWDITFLPGPRIRETYACHTAIDLYSRAVVGAVVSAREDTRAAAQMFTRLLKRYTDIHTVHSDNGASMTSTTLARLFRNHGVHQSFSRPHTSNDNPHIESLFHTMKGTPYYPKVFTSINDAAAWVEDFTTLYNNRPHSGINHYTPRSVLDGTWQTLQTNRQQAAQEAINHGRIHALPATRTGLPEHVTIIRTTTATQPTPQPLTTNH
nr:putative transposase [Streptococcus thermophilus]